MAQMNGIRILDLSRLLPGPYATQLLADMGAEVIKVERPPEGDYMRAVPPLIVPDAGDEREPMAAFFPAINRGKKSIALNYTSAAGLRVLLRLVAAADVFVESFRPGALDRRGLGYDALREINPGLVYSSLSSYGQNGPYRDRAGHDVDALALSGVLGLNAAPGGPPHLLPVQLADLALGMTAAVRILGALVERGKTGKGQFIDTSLYDAAVDWTGTIVGPYYRATGNSPGPGESPLTGLYPCYNLYETADGSFMALGALEPNFWKTFCEKVGREDLVPRHQDPSAIPEVAALFCAKSREQWMEFALSVDVCLEPVLTLQEAFDHPQLRARVGIRPDSRRVPRMGEDTLQVLRSAGVSEQELDELIAKRIVVSR